MKSRCLIFLHIYAFLFLLIPELFASIDPGVWALKARKKHQTQKKLVYKKGTWLTKKLEVPTNKGILKTEIHFERANLAFAQRVAKVLRDDTAGLLDYFEHIPSWTVHFIVEDKEQANGSATIFPTNIIRLNNFPPIGASYLHSMDDWLQGLVLHELTHIIHMDQTNGFLGALVYIFGSYGKWGGMAPRWFLEGVAVWAESEFTSGGRLTSRMLEFETVQKFFLKGFCQSIDCLDEPGTYPYGSTAYWVGAKFLSFLEQKKKGLIKCLLVENSDNIPFMLNDAFHKCAGSNAPDLFQKFRKFHIKRAIIGYKKIKKLNFFKKDFKRYKVQGHQKSVVWQKGFELLNDQLVKVIFDDKISYFEFLSTNTGKKEKVDFGKFPRKVESQTAYSIKSKKYVFGLNGHSKNLLGKATTKRWYLYDQKKKRKSEIKFEYSADYVFLISEQVFLYLNFKKDRWQVYLKKNGKEFLIYQYQKFDEIFEPRLLERDQKLWIGSKIFHPKKNKTEQAFTYELTEVRTRGRKNTIANKRLIYSQKESFKYIGSCQKKDLFLFKNKIIVKKNNITELFQLPPGLEIVTAQVRSQSSILLLKSDPLHVYIYKKSCGSFLKKISTFKSYFKKEKKKEIYEVAQKKEKENLKDVESYPSLGHFAPHYWIFNWIAGNNVDVLSASTALSDPMGRHRFGLGYHFYLGLEKSSPLLNYTYQVSRFHLGVSYGETYSQTSMRARTDSAQYLNSSVGYSTNFGALDYYPSLSFEKSKTQDFISNRENKTFEFSQTFSYLSDQYYHFFQSFSLNYRLSRIDSDNRSKAYVGHQGKTNIGFRHSRNVYSLFKGTYGKLNKKGLSAGILYGGGFESYGLSRYHDFYGVPYADAFGNEIITSRLQVGARLLEVYSAYNSLFPLFIKELHLLLGADFLKTDFIFVNNKLFFGNEIMSIHGGLSVKLTLGYVLPLRLDLIYAEVITPENNRVRTSLLRVVGIKL